MNTQENAPLGAFSSKEREISMKSYQNLPEGYREIYALDLQKNKKLSILVNGIATLIAAVMVITAHLFIPVTTLYDVDVGYGFYFARLIVILIGMFLYMVLHELTHGVAMKLCGTRKVKYGFTGMYAFAGSEDYYAKKAYIFIALAPVVLFFVIFLVLNLILPTEWFWVVYILQVINCSGAAGDLFVTAKFSKLPCDILVKDHGVGMTVFSKE